MTLTGSLVLFAIGAILYWAVEFELAGINLDVVGLILMVVAGIGFVLSILFWSSFAPFRRERRVVVDEHGHRPLDPP